ncbi:hypothetical protein D1872_293800 [compost metagenome]
MNSEFKVKFAVAWTLTRVADSLTTWYILKRGIGRELNPLATRLIASMGLDVGLTLFTVIGIVAGLSLLVIVPRVLQCEWCVTRFDRMIFSALGRERVAVIIMYTAVVLSLVPALVNFTVIAAFELFCSGLAT